MNEIVYKKNYMQNSHLNEVLLYFFNKFIRAKHSLKFSTNDDTDFESVLFINSFLKHFCLFDYKATSQAF